MNSDFAFGVLQTTIGSFIGFLLGILAFHYQQSRQSANEQQEKQRNAIEALNRIEAAAATNIENIAMIKKQLVSDLRPEAMRIKALCEEFYDKADAEKPVILQKLRTMSVEAHHFYRSFTGYITMEPPKFREYAELMPEMPALSTFVHRAIGMMRALNEHMDARNSLIAEHARENGVPDGMTDQRLIYFSSMIAGNSEAVWEHADFALDFWRLAQDQINIYIKEKNITSFIKYDLSPTAANCLPAEELFPLMRNQIKKKF